MDPNDFFTIVSTDDHVLHIENKGFWSFSVVKELGRTMLSRFRQAASKTSQDGPFIILADLRELEVLSREGRKLLSEVMQSAKDYGMYKSVEVVPNAITRLSIRDAAEMTGKPDFRIATKSFDEALALVEQLKAEMLAASADQECTLAE